MAQQLHEAATDFGYRVHMSISYEEAISRVKEELQKEGFGVLTELNVRDKLKEKLGADFRKYVIMGACHPQLAYQALQQDLSVGMLMPCNVIVYEEGDGAVVGFVKPEEVLNRLGNKALEPVAREADERVRRAYERLK